MALRDWRYVEVKYDFGYAKQVGAEADLRGRQPLVFLNACESGRLGASLTEWDCWPKTFWERGAGAFVGISWPVRENPARVFAEAFYEALLGGRTLGEAAGAAREAAKPLGDASWLAASILKVVSSRFLPFQYSMRSRK